MQHDDIQNRKLQMPDYVGKYAKFKRFQMKIAHNQVHKLILFTI